MKYKVGDKVRIKTWKQLEEEFGLNELGYIDNHLLTPAMEEGLNNASPDRVEEIKSIEKITHNRLCKIKYYMLETIGMVSDSIIEEVVT